ncbi:hypothetical protein Tco_1017978 [Tanacetum coccineum]|uniref:Uncharacterized protein n=1 Tax=Tanacetum coccineum TaxID=301880 RepID=A0ABQ5FUD7_9ASTR
MATDDYAAGLSDWGLSGSQAQPYSVGTVFVMELHQFACLQKPLPQSHGLCIEQVESENGAGWTLNELARKNLSKPEGLVVPEHPSHGTASRKLSMDSNKLHVRGQERMSGGSEYEMGNTNVQDVDDGDKKDGGWGMGWGGRGVVRGDWGRGDSSISWTSTCYWSKIHQKAEKTAISTSEAEYDRPITHTVLKFSGCGEGSGAEILDMTGRGD